MLESRSILFPKLSVAGKCACTCDQGEALRSCLATMARHFVGRMSALSAACIRRDWVRIPARLATRSRPI